MTSGMTVGTVGMNASLVSLYVHAGTCSTRMAGISQSNNILYEYVIQGIIVLRNV